MTDRMIIRLIVDLIWELLLSGLGNSCYRDWGIECSSDPLGIGLLLGEDAVGGGLFIVIELHYQGSLHCGAVV